MSERGETRRLGEVTELLRAANGGDDDASQRLFALLYADLKRLAHARLRKDSGSAELNTTTLVHESFLRLAGHERHTPADKRAFCAYVGRVMRSVVIDAVRERQARKRGGDQVLVTLTTGVEQQPLDADQLIAIDDALNVLGTLAPDLRDLVEMRYFAGLTVADVGDALGKPLRTVERDWQKARMLLRQLIAEN
jgi:RNA polymerase sigma factor (TIGR02999 family)